MPVFSLFPFVHLTKTFVLQSPLTRKNAPDVWLLNHSVRGVLFIFYCSASFKEICPQTW